MSIIGKLKYGTKIEIDKEYNGFGRIVGNNGWVCLDYLIVDGVTHGNMSCTVLPPLLNVRDIPSMSERDVIRNKIIGANNGITKCAFCGVNSGSNIGVCASCGAPLV